MTKENEMKTSLVMKRISAYLIDVLLVFLLVGLISEIKFINPNYDKYMEYYSQYSELLEDYENEEISEEEFNDAYYENYYYVSKYGISYNIVIVIVIILYFGIFQKFNKGQTLGKKIMGIRIVNNNSLDNVSLGKYLLRLLPMYYIYIGGLLPVIINTILVYVLNNNVYINVTLIVSYVFLGIAIGSLIVMNLRKDKRGLQDIISGTKVIYEEKEKA